MNLIKEYYLFIFFMKNILIYIYIYSNMNLNINLTNIQEAVESTRVISIHRIPVSKNYT